MAFIRETTFGGRGFPQRRYEEKRVAKTWHASHVSKRDGHRLPNVIQGSERKISDGDTTLRSTVDPAIRSSHARVFTKSERCRPCQAAFRRACVASMARAGVDGDTESTRECGTCGSPAVGSVAGMRLCKRDARPVASERSAAGAKRQAS
eukprot:5644597-Pleurochrysis_carterae.AAC.2